jgi:hypothetical protein
MGIVPPAIGPVKGVERGTGRSRRIFAGRIVSAAPDPDALICFPLAMVSAETARSV